MRRLLFCALAMAVAFAAAWLCGADLATGLKLAAVVTGPLFSMTASGTVGDNITFDKRGFVRQRVIPANPQSDAQGNVRQILLAIQKGLTRLGETVIASVKTVAPTSYRWNSFLVQLICGSSHAEFDASKTAFAALGSTAIGHWDDSGITAGLVAQQIPYATDAAISPGLQLFAISRSLFGLGLNVSAGAPGATNYAAWETYFVS